MAYFDKVFDKVSKMAGLAQALNTYAIPAPARSFLERILPFRRHGVEFKTGVKHNFAYGWRVDPVPLGSNKNVVTYTDRTTHFPL